MGMRLGILDDSAANVRGRVIGIYVSMLVYKLKRYDEIEIQQATPLN